MSAAAGDIVDAWQAALVGRERRLLRDVTAPDVHYEDPLVPAGVAGHDPLCDHVARMWATFPDAVAERVGERLTDGRWIAAPVLLRGTHSGTTADIPPTGRTIAVHVVFWCELDPPRERLWRIRAFYDLYGAAQQIGWLPRHGGAGERALRIIRGFGLRS